MMGENIPAFPLAVPSDCQIQPEYGMTLRDWFATHAPPPPATWWGSGPVTSQGYAMWAYQHAAAMLAARSAE